MAFIDTTVWETPEKTLKERLKELIDKFRKREDKKAHPIDPLDPILEERN